MAAFPIPGVDVGELDDFLPVVHIVEGGAAGLDHGAVDLGNEHPVDAEHILAAVGGRINRGALDHEATGHVVGPHLGAEQTGLAAQGQPHGLMLQEHALVGLSGGDGGVVNGGDSAAEAGDLGNDFEFFLVEGNRHGFLSLSKIFKFQLSLITHCRQCGTACKAPPGTPGSWGRRTWTGTPWCPSCRSAPRTCARTRAAPPRWRWRRRR